VPMSLTDAQLTALIEAVDEHHIDNGHLLSSCYVSMDCEQHTFYRLRVSTSLCVLICLPTFHVTMSSLLAHVTSCFKLFTHISCDNELTVSTAECHAGIKLDVNIFTALHVMQTRYIEENSVRLSVRHTRDP